MINKGFRILGILICIYLVGSLLLNSGFKDPTFKREFIIYNYSSGEVNINTVGITETFDEGIIFQNGSRHLLFTDTDRSPNKKIGFILRKNNAILFDSRTTIFKQLGKGNTLKMTSISITSNGGIIEENKIFFPFYITQPIYIYIYIYIYISIK